jgi:hypothetical protein
VNERSGARQEWDIRSGRIEVEVEIRRREFREKKIKNLVNISEL